MLSESSIVQLAGVRSRQCTGHCNRAADELLRVLEGETERPVVIGVEHNTELWSPSPGQSHLKVRIHIQAGENITWQRRETIAVRCSEQGLTAQEFPSASLHIYPIKTHARRIAVTGYEYVCRLKADEVKLHKTSDVEIPGFCGDLQIESGVLRAEPRLRQSPRSRIREWD